MAGTMPHAIFVETGLDGGSTVAAYAAELPGCATFAAADAEAVAALPRRVARFSAATTSRPPPSSATTGTKSSGPPATVRRPVVLRSRSTSFRRRTRNGSAGCGG